MRPDANGGGVMGGWCACFFQTRMTRFLIYEALPDHPSGQRILRYFLHLRETGIC